MLASTIKSILLIVLGGCLYFLLDLLILSNPAEKAQDLAIQEKNELVQVQTKADPSKSQDKNISKIKNSPPQLTEKTNTSKEEQNEIIDRMNQQNIALAESEEDKKFFIKQAQVDKNRVSRDFQSNQDYTDFFNNDSYDPVWAPNVERQVDELLLDNNGQLVVQGVNLNSRQCKMHFCQVTFTHSTNDKESILKHQSKLIQKLSNVDMNLHRNYTFFLNEENMMSYFYIERCLTCE